MVPKAKFFSKTSLTLSQKITVPKPQRRGKGGTGLIVPVLPPLTMKRFQRPLNVFDSDVHQCSYGNYPWDDWERDALSAGVSKELAGLGRLTVREAYQHDWDDPLKSLCGWYDQGRRMIRLALRSPQRAERRWNHLLETDGLRGYHDVETGEWIFGYGRPRRSGNKEAQ